MKFALMQPYFFPYIGYFSLIDSVDHFMFFDDTQFRKKSWMCRNKLLNISKEKEFYIRPELNKVDFQCELGKVELKEDEKWKNVLKDQIKVYKNKARFYTETLDLLDLILEPKYRFLAEFNMKSTIVVARFLSISTKIDKFTDYDFWFKNKPGIGEWGREVGLKVNASSYINAPSGEAFILPEYFKSCNIKLGFIQPNIKAYRQASSNFVKGLSILDVLMFNGKDITQDLLKDYFIEWKS